MGLKVHDLIHLIKRLRKGCPWDRAQTLASIKNNIIEEAYELAEAIDTDDTAAIREEIGDVLFLGFFLARIFEEEKGIALDKVLARTCKKYKDKHPHVFRDKHFADQHEVLKFWQRHKKDVFRGIPKTLPALLAARVIQERASKLGFDWESQTGPREKIVEELREITKSKAKKKVFEECGDLLFACVNLARHLNIEPEDALRNANKKFARRFTKVLARLRRQGKSVEESNLREMDELWEDIKRGESSHTGASHER